MTKAIFDVGARYCLGLGIGALAYFPCESFARYLNRHKSQPKLDLTLVDRDVKIHCLCIGVLVGPVIEEMLYRGFLQGVLLEKISKRTSRPLLSKCARILAVALLFAAPHHNKEYTFFLGLELGLIKESKLKLAGSIGAHMANNLLSLKPLFIKEHEYAN